MARGWLFDWFLGINSELLKTFEIRGKENFENFNKKKALYFEIGFWKKIEVVIWSCTFENKLGHISRNIK